MNTFETGERDGTGEEEMRWMVGFYEDWRDLGMLRDKLNRSGENQIQESEGIITNGREEETASRSHVEGLPY